MQARSQMLFWSAAEMLVGAGRTDAIVRDGDTWFKVQDVASQLFGCECTSGKQGKLCAHYVAALFAYVVRSEYMGGWHAFGNLLCQQLGTNYGSDAGCRIDSGPGPLLAQLGLRSDPDIAAQPYVAALAAGANAAQQHVQRDAVPGVTSVQAPRRTSALLQVQCDPTRVPLGAPAGTSDALLPRSDCVHVPVALWQAVYDAAASLQPRGSLMAAQTLYAPAATQALAVAAIQPAVLQHVQTAGYMLERQAFLGHHLQQVVGMAAQHITHTAQQAAAAAQPPAVHRCSRSAPSVSATDATVPADPAPCPAPTNVTSAAAHASQPATAATPASLATPTPPVIACDTACPADVTPSTAFVNTSGSALKRKLDEAATACKTMPPDARRRTHAAVVKAVGAATNATLNLSEHWDDQTGLQGILAGADLGAAGRFNVQPQRHKSRVEKSHELQRLASRSPVSKRLAQHAPNSERASALAVQKDAAACPSTGTSLPSDIGTSGLEPTALRKHHDSKKRPKGLTQRLQHSTRKLPVGPVPSLDQPGAASGAVPQQPPRAGHGGGASNRR